jgi:hypothetical protein
MSCNENFLYPQEGENRIGNGFYEREQDINQGLTSGQVANLTTLSNLSRGTYRLGLFVRLESNADGTLFTGLSMGLSGLTNITTYQTALYKFPAVVDNGKPIKLGFNEMIIVSNDTNSLSLGVTPTYSGGDFILTDWFLNVNKIA